MATLIAPDHPSAVEDAEALQKACKGNLNFTNYMCRDIHFSSLSWQAYQIHCDQ